jgi:hypothetical protein
MGNKCDCKCLQDSLKKENELNTSNVDYNRQTFNKDGSTSTNLTNINNFDSKNDEKKFKNINKNKQNFNPIEENNAEEENYNSQNANKFHGNYNYNNDNNNYINNNNNINNNEQFNNDYNNNDNLNIIDFNNSNTNNNNTNNEYILSNNNYTTKQNKNELPITSSNNNIDSQVIKSTVFYEQQNEEEKNDKSNQQINQILDETADNHAKPSDEFSLYIFEKINDIRQNPQNYISILEKAKENIITDKKTRKLIYKSNNSKVKVAMNRGADAFDEAILFLNGLQPMEPLIYHPLITVNAPENEDELKDKNYLKDEVAKFENKNIFIKSFFRDIVKDPESSFILLIADDNKNSGKKRSDILDPNKKYIGIVSKKIEKSFACYITFADKN